MKKSSLGAVVLALSMGACGDGPLEEDPCQVEATVVYSGMICETDEAMVYGEELTDYVAIPAIPLIQCQPYPQEALEDIKGMIYIVNGRLGYSGTGEILDNGRIRIVEGYGVYDCSK